MPSHGDRPANWGYAVLCYDKDKNIGQELPEGEGSPQGTLLQRLKASYMRLIWRGEPQAKEIAIECLKVRSAALRATSDALRAQGHSIVEVFPGITDKEYAETLESELPGPYICFTVRQLKAALSSQSMVLLPQSAYAAEPEQAVWQESE